MSQAGRMPGIAREFDEVGLKLFCKPDAHDKLLGLCAQLLLHVDRHTGILTASSWLL